MPIPPNGAKMSAQLRIGFTNSCPGQQTPTNAHHQVKFHDTRGNDVLDAGEKTAN